MKIGIIQTVIGSGGGNDQVLFALLDKLKDTKHKITIYTVSEPRSDLSRFNVGKTLKTEFIKTKKLLPMKMPIFGIYQKMLEPLLAKKAQHEDLLISLTGDLFLPANKKQRLIFYSQNNYIDPSKMNTSKYKKGMWKLYYLPYKRMISKMLKNIKKYNIDFVGNSDFVRNQLKTGLNVEATVIYPPVNIQEFTNSNKERNGIMTVTRFSQEKNIEKIIDLVGDLKCSRRIFGSVSEINKHYMNKLVKRGKDKNMIFHINQPKDLMKRLLEKSKLTISTSDETFGIAVVEAIASGCIPIVPNTTAHKETVPFEILRPIEKESDEEIKIRIEKALKGEYDYLLPKLQEHIKKFDEKVFQNKFMELIENR